MPVAPVVPDSKVETKESKTGRCSALLSGFGFGGALIGSTKCIHRVVTIHRSATPGVVPAGTLTGGAFVVDASSASPLAE